MGLSIDQEIELTDDINGLIQLMELETATIDSLRINDNIDYQLLTTTEKLSKLNLKLQKSNFLPTVAGFYNRHEDFDNNFFNDQSPDMVGLSLRFTILSSGQRLSQVGQAKLEYMKAQTNTKMFSEMLLIQYETMLASYLSARDVFNMQKENRDLSYRVYLKSITKFQEGVGSSLDMNQAQSQYFTAESNYYGALMTLVTTRSNLENLLSKNN
jgi:outer membrane protein TolC